VFQIPLREFENMKSEDIPILIHKETVWQSNIILKIVEFGLS
jgi:hypothetical protein